MEKTVTRDQMNTILEGRPKGVSGKEIIDTYVANGYKVEGINYEKPEPQKESGLSRVASIYSKNLKEQALGGVENAQKSFGMGVDTMQQAQQMPMDTQNQKDKAFTTATAGAGQIGVGAMSGTIQTAFSPLTALIQTGVQGLSELDQATGGKIQNQLSTLAQSHPELIKGYSDMVTQNPKTAQFVMDSINVLTAGLGGKPALEAVQGATKGLVTGTKEALSSSPKTVGGLPVASLADEALNSGYKLKNDIQLSIAKKNVSPQLESSANRLIQNTVENPVNTYDKYLDQSKKSLADIKIDSPISTVGSKIGDAFMKVVKQKQQVGSVLGDELKTVGKLRVSVASPKGTLLTELKDSGLSYNPKINELTSFQGSKFAPEEVSMLNQYVKDVQALGEMPTVSQIDNFIAKTRSDLTFAKGKSGVTGTTNAERIIKGNLNGLRESLNPEKNGLPQLSKYWNANKAYSELSDFVDEGAGFLGKTTQSGDFAKDASVAKSSVQSILNGGKKDWLIKLEGITGYPALDESVLALQAMKDAGDFKGLSLLQAMQESGGIPTSKAGFTQKILDMAVARGEKLIVGTPEEQTRALLQDLSNKAKINNTPSAPSINNPTGGQSTQSIKSSRPSVISPNSTPKEIKGKGIRGMLNFSEWIPDLKAQVKSAESALSVGEKVIVAEDLGSTLSKMGINVGPVTEKNVDNVIERAKKAISDERIIAKKEAMSTPGVKMVNDRFIKNPTTGKLEGSSKKKVATSLEQEAKKYKSDGFKTDGKTITLYRGIGGNSKLEGNYFTGDKNYANEFTQSGLPEQLKQVKVNIGDIYRPKVLPEAVNSKEMEITIKEAKQKGYKAILVDENGADTPSVFFIDKVSKDFYK